MSIGPKAKSICKTLGKGSNRGKWDKHDSTRGSCVDQRLNVDDSTPMASIIDSIHNNFQFFVMTMTRSINVVLANPRFSGRFGNTGDSTRIASSITPSKYLILIFHSFFFWMWWLMYRIKLIGYDSFLTLNIVFPFFTIHRNPVELSMSWKLFLCAPRYSSQWWNAVKS